MFRVTSSVCALALAMTAGSALAAPAHRAARKPGQVEMIYMTWPEIYNAIHHEGKTTVLIYNGGTEQRGPQCVLGGHTLMGEKTANLIAEKLGNALVAPVMPFSPTGVSDIHPGGVSVSPELFAQVNEAVVDSEVKNGFKNIILMGDHGGGQKQLAEVAEKKNAQYASQGVHVFFCSDVYKKANDQFNDYLTAHHLPVSEHAGIPDTSEMIYFGGAKWVRMNEITVGDPIPPPGQRPVLKVNNGIIGDARGSSARLGKLQVDMKVDAAVRQIRGFLAGESAGRR
ncbi:MAG TPA: creatininase family protein [Vicinamibacterales bacterium]|nr:creatininase family protein [Vicinamibacterales bacterium]